VLFIFLKSIFESIFSKIEEADIGRRRDTVPFAVSMR
jgi:hypothetical protein